MTDSTFLGGQSRDAGRGASPQEEKQARAGTAPVSRSARPPCNADVGHPCDANDGKPCVECADWMEEVEAAARWGWGALSPQERDADRYEREMREAGRRQP